MSKVHIVNIHTTDCSGMKNYYYIGKSKKGNPLSNPFTYDPNHNSAKNLTFKLENPNDSHGIVIADELRKKAIREQIARKRLEALNHA